MQSEICKKRIQSLRVEWNNVDLGVEWEKEDENTKLETE